MLGLLSQQASTLVPSLYTVEDVNPDPKWLAFLDKTLLTIISLIYTSFLEAIRLEFEFKQK